MVLETKYKYILGIDFGADFSEVAIAHVNDPFNIFVIQNWDKGKKNASRKQRQFYSSIMYPNSWIKSISCGVYPDAKTTGDIYIPSIKDYLLNIEKSDKKLGQLKKGLSTKKMFADFLSNFLKKALDRLKNHKEFSQSINFNRDFSLDKIGFCLVCPKSLQKFMRDCFIYAGVIKDREIAERLAFVTQVEAIAYHQISLDRQVSELVPDNSYLICHIDEISVGIARINVNTTESFCAVELVVENSKNGTASLEVKFREYLEENSKVLCLDSTIIDNLVAHFVENIKFNFNMIRPQNAAFERFLDINGNQINISFDDLNRAVFLPSIHNTTDMIIKANHGDVNGKIILSGKYGSDPYFIENLLYDTNGNSMHDLYHIEETHYALCSGAVSSAIRLPSIQIPFVNDGVADNQTEADINGDNEEEEDSYDFIVGIDFGTSTSGCSYVDVRKNKPFVIKTIKDGWPLTDSEKVPTSMILDKQDKPLYWGEEAILKAKQDSHLNYAKCFKLILGLHSLDKFYNQNEDIQRLKDSYKDKYNGYQTFAIELTTVYLRLLKHHILQYIIEKESEDELNIFTSFRVSKSHKVKYVITVPSRWDISEHRIFSRAIESDFVEKDRRNRLVLISEPEAASLSFKKQFMEYFPNQQKTTYILCDADEFTVNVVAMQMEVFENQDNDKSIPEPLFSQISDGFGDTCGSQSLNDRLKKYILKIYDTAGIHVKSSELHDINVAIETFEREHRRDFMPSQSADSLLDLDLVMDKRKIKFPSSTSYHMIDNNDSLRIPDKDLKDEIFDPVIERVIYLLNRQKNQIEYNGNKLDAILMVGNFSQVKYLQQCIKERYRRICQVIYHDNYHHAFSYGAAYYGLNEKSKKDKKHTGFSLSLEVQAPIRKASVQNDASSKKVKGPNGLYYTKNRLSYFVRNGQELKKRGQRKHSQLVQIEYPNSAIIAIFSSDSDEDAKVNRVANCHKKVMETRVNMPTGVAGLEKGDMIDFLVSLHMDEYDATVEIVCQNPLINADKNMVIISKRIPLTIDSNDPDLESNDQRRFVEYSLANRDDSKNYSMERLDLDYNFITNTFM